MIPEILMAAKIALPSDYAPNDRSFWLGCIGIRQDGVLVSAKNGAAQLGGKAGDVQFIPNVHAEGRVLRKLGKGGIMYVARVSKNTGELKMARPCGICQVRIKSAKVEKVFYSIDSDHYGIWFVNEDYDKIYEV